MRAQMLYLIRGWAKEKGAGVKSFHLCLVQRCRVDLGVDFWGGLDISLTVANRYRGKRKWRNFTQ